MKLEKDFFIKNIEGDFYYSTVELQGQIDLTDDEKREYFKTGGCKNIKAKLIIELTKPILDEEERKYLSGVIRPFRDDVKYIKKIEYTESEYIQIVLKSFDSCCINLPFFKKGTMYKNMKPYKEYTLRKLGL